MGVLGDRGREAVEFALKIECRFARRVADKHLMQAIARPHRAAERGERRVRLDRDAAPAREIERERDVVVDRMAGADVDVEAGRLPVEAAPEMEILEALRVGEGWEASKSLSASGAARSAEPEHNHKATK